MRRVLVHQHETFAGLGHDVIVMNLRPRLAERIIRQRGVFHWRRRGRWQVHVEGGLRFPQARALKRRLRRHDGPEA